MCKSSFLWDEGKERGRACGRVGTRGYLLVFGLSFELNMEGISRLKNVFFVCGDKTILSSEKPD